MLSNSVLVLNKTEIWENPSLASIQIPLPACSLFSTERLLFSVTVKIKKNKKSSQEHHIWVESAAAAAKSLQSCPTLCDPIDGSPPGSTVPGILQARTMEWVAISFSNAGKWEVKVKVLSHVWLFMTPWTAAYQAPPSMGFSRQEYWSGVPLPSPWVESRKWKSLPAPKMEPEGGKYVEQSLVY